VIRVIFSYHGDFSQNSAIPGPNITPDHDVFRRVSGPKHEPCDAVPESTPDRRRARAGHQQPIHVSKSDRSIMRE
jgi:hypothetical protein